jgi:hypothetical protein
LIVITTIELDVTSSKGEMPMFTRVLNRVSVPAFGRFVRIPNVCEAYIHYLPTDTSYVDAWRDEDGSFTIHLGRIELIVSPWATVKACRPK